MDFLAICRRWKVKIMGFNLKKKKSIFGFSPAKEKMKLMTRIAKLLDDDEYAEAHPLLDEAVKKYPDERLLWEMYAQVGNELQLTPVMQKAFAKLVQLQPNEPDHWQNLAISYAMGTYPALTARAFKEFARRFPHDSRKDKALEMVKFAEEQIGGMLEAYNIPYDETGKEIAVLHDRVQLYMHHREYEKSIQNAHELLKKAPDFIAPYNNLSLVYFMKGDIENAVKTSQQALEKQPENFHALGNTIRFLAFLGKADEAQNYANRLRTLESKFDDIYTKKIEAFAFLGDDELVAETYKEIEKKKIELKDEGYCKNLAAFSFYQLGNEKKAKKLWEEASDDDSDEADENLEELELPVYDRNVFALGLNYWLPHAYTNELLKLTDNIKDDDKFDTNLKRKTNQFFDKYPNIISIFPTILERSNLRAKEFVIRLIKWSENPKALEVLKEFALGKKGSDAIRTNASMTLTELKVLPKTVKLWVKGEQTEVSTRSFFITGESSVDKVYPMDPKAKKIFQKGVVAMQNGNFDLAQEYFKKTAEIQADHPALINNQLFARRMKGEKIDHEKELRDLNSRFPKYLFAAMSLGLLEVMNKNIEAAKKLLAQFDDKEEWHITEFNQYSKLQIEICLAEELFEGARSWFEQMKSFNENFELTKAEEDDFAEIESRIRIRELYSKVSSGLGKLIGKGKGKKKKK
jgi:tetratricopeptide (TPR) repeat protein